MSELDRALLSRLRGVFDDPAEHQRYLAAGWRRTEIIASLVGRLHVAGVRRVLELGSNPYFLTLLMRRRYDFDLDLANYFGTELGEGRYTHRGELDGEVVEFPYAHFNVETQPFPYEDGAFDAVLFCEILEHLLVDPDRAVAEMARVLRPGGFLLITTPNATRVTNLYFLAMGRSIWDDYSPHGPYGRHNREYTLDEVTALMGRHGFAPHIAEVRNVQDLARRFTYLQKLRPRVWNEHLFVVGRRR